ncbi:hypothetical protein [Pelagicoccus albus]|uniref:Uncharacterized protein n=1 Tax=Pelagicoccus albus TaxID=415222 RepID=A0A7X1B9I4_9BACT|nr:hypothetical protein [Pelagicoccus albus]MBC2608159.1 hypothetical protein [Pelagicoccus albus]
MKSTNRFEEAWAPQWDMGLQGEFGFASEVEESESDTADFERVQSWEGRGEESETRKSAAKSDILSIGELVDFLETLSVELASE